MTGVPWCGFGPAMPTPNGLPPVPNPATPSAPTQATPVPSPLVRVDLPPARGPVPARARTPPKAAAKRASKPRSRGSGPKAKAPRAKAPTAAQAARARRAAQVEQARRAARTLESDWLAAWERHGRVMRKRFHELRGGLRSPDAKVPVAKLAADLDANVKARKGRAKDLKRAEDAVTSALARLVAR